MSYVTRMLKLAARASRVRKDERQFCLCAVAERNDGTTVMAVNLPVADGPRPYAHAEARLSRKLDRGATVFVARTTATGAWANARCCEDCERALRNAYVKRVYYTVGPGEYGVLRLK